MPWLTPAAAAMSLIRVASKPRSLEHLAGCHHEALPGAPTARGSGARSATARRHRRRRGGGVTRASGRAAPPGRPRGGPAAARRVPWPAGRAGWCRRRLGRGDHGPRCSRPSGSASGWTSIARPRASGSSARSASAVSTVRQPRRTRPRPRVAIAASDPSVGRSPLSPERRAARPQPGRRPTGADVRPSPPLSPLRAPAQRAQRQRCVVMADARPPTACPSRVTTCRHVLGGHRGRPVDAVRARSARAARREQARDRRPASPR